MASDTIPPEVPPTRVAPVIDLRIGYLFAAVGAVLFSTKGIVIKLAYAEGLDAETILSLRMIFSVPVFLVIGLLALRDRRQRGVPLPSGRLFLRAVLVGALGYWVASYADFLGLEFISAQFERVILFTYPLFVVLFGALFFGQRVRLAALGAILVGYVGIALMFAEKLNTLGNAAAIGVGLVLGSAVAYALYQLLAKDVIAEMGPRLFTCVAMTSAGIIILAQFFLSHPASDLAMTPKIFFYAVFIAIGSTVLPSFFLNAALHRISAQANSTIGMISPVVTILLAYLILGERLSPIDMAGTLLVLGGVGWFAFAERKG